MTAPLLGTVHPMLPDTVGADAIVAAVRAARVEFLITLPDMTTSQSVLAAIETGQDFRQIKVCKEDEGFGIAAGLSFCDRRAMMLIQYTGLLDSINAMRSVGVEYGLPICLMVGLLEKEPDRAPRDSAHYGVRIVEPILDAMGVTHCLIETRDDAAKIEPVIHNAYQTSQPAVMLIGRRPRPQETRR